MNYKNITVASAHISATHRPCTVPSVMDTHITLSDKPSSTKDIPPVWMVAQDCWVAARHFPPNLCTRIPLAGNQLAAHTRDTWASRWPAANVYMCRKSTGDTEEAEGIWIRTLVGLWVAAAVECANSHCRRCNRIRVDRKCIETAEKEIMGS